MVMSECVGECPFLYFLLISHLVSLDCKLNVNTGLRNSVFGDWLGLAGFFKF